MTQYLDPEWEHKPFKDFVQVPLYLKEKLESVKETISKKPESVISPYFISAIIEWKKGLWNHIDIVANPAKGNIGQAIYVGHDYAKEYRNAKNRLKAMPKNENNVKLKLGEVVIQILYAKLVENRKPIAP